MFLVITIFLAIVSFYSCQKTETKQIIEDQHEIANSIIEDNGSADLRTYCNNGDLESFAFYVDYFRDASGCIYQPLNATPQTGYCNTKGSIKLIWREDCIDTVDLYDPVQIWEDLPNCAHLFTVGDALRYQIVWDEPTVYSGGTGTVGRPAKFTVRETVAGLNCGGVLQTFEVYPNEFSYNGGAWTTTPPNSTNYHTAKGRYLIGCKVLGEDILCE